jgi:hypothetical protein
MRQSFKIPIALDVMIVLGIAATAVFTVEIPQENVEAQAQAPSAKIQAPPPNVKTRPMTSEELKKAQADAVRQARGTRRTTMRNPALGLARIQPQVLTILQQQKTFVAGHGIRMASQQTASGPLLRNQGILGPTTPMSSGNPPSSNSGAAATAAKANTGLKTTQDPRLLAPQPLKGMTAVCRSPVISDVNGKPTKAVFTSEPEYNQYVIRGCFFGTAMGKAYLVGKFNALEVALQPTYWVDNEIDARVDPNVAGELDQDNVSLVVAPVKGQEIKAGGFQFYAVRSDPAVLLPYIPQNWVWLSAVGGNVINVVNQPNVGIKYSSPVTSDDPSDAQGWTVYVGRWSNSKFDPLEDYFHFYLATGWTTDSFQPLLYDNPVGCGGVVTYRQSFGTWDPEFDGNDIRVHWTDMSCSGFVPQPPVFPLIVTTYTDNTASQYALKVWVRGPRCTDPYSGKLQPQCVQNVRSCGSETCGH